MTASIARIRAYTLIELSVVVLILAMVGALVVPRYISVVRGDVLRKFENDLPTRIRDAKYRAMTTGQTVILSYSSSSNEIGLKSSDGEDSLAPGLALPDEAEVMSVRVGKEDSPASDWQMKFYPDGTSDGGGIAFRFDGRSRSLIIVGQTSGVRWQDGELPELEQEEWPAGELEQRIPADSGS